MRPRQRLAQVEEMLRLRPRIAEFGQRVRRRAVGLVALAQPPRRRQIIVVGIFDLTQHLLLMAGGQFGRLFLQPPVQLAAGLQELPPGRLRAVHRVAQPDIVDFAQRILEVLRNAETFRIHRLQLHAQLARLFLGQHRRQGDEHAHQARRHTQRRQPEFRRQIHRGGVYTRPAGLTRRTAPLPFLAIPFLIAGRIAIEFANKMAQVSHFVGRTEFTKS